MTGVSLAIRLRELRQGLALTQKELGALLRPDAPLSVSLVSSWEKRQGAAQPGEDWVERVAALQAGEWARRQEDPRVLADHEFTDSERARFEQLQAELRGLRNQRPDRLEVVRDEEAPDEPGFWRFDDDLPITIIASALPESELETNPYANYRHPNYMPLLAFSDGDAVMEIYGHLRAENPEATVRYMRPADVRANPDRLKGHVVIIGGGDLNEYAEWFAERMNLPVAGESEFKALAPGVPTENAQFVIQDRDPENGHPVGEPISFAPIFEGKVRTTLVRIDETGAPVRETVQWPKLVYDVALVARQQNPANLEATATLCYGLYSRGTFGAVRTFTDPLLAPANERYRRDRFGDSDAYWMLLRIACNWGIATTPDLRRSFLRLREWSDTESQESRP